MGDMVKFEGGVVMFVEWQYASMVCCCLYVYLSVLTYALNISSSSLHHDSVYSQDSDVARVIC